MKIKIRSLQFYLIIKIIAMVLIGIDCVLSL